MFFAYTDEQKDDILAAFLFPVMLWICTMMTSLILMYMGGSFFARNLTAVAHIAPFAGGMLLAFLFYLFTAFEGGFGAIWWAAGVSALIGIGSLWLSSVVNAESGLFRSVPNHDYIPLAQTGISFLLAAAVLTALKPLISPKQV